MQKTIVLSEEQKTVLSRHAEQKNPNESCAILFGKIEEFKSTVNEIFLTENIDESPRNFTISNEDLLRAYKIAEEKKMDVVGIFHSHPKSDAFPSDTDKKFMKANPVAWVIFSNVDKSFKAYVLDSEIKEISISG